MSALPLEPGTQQDEGSGQLRAGQQWPLLPTRPGSSWFASVLGAASRSGNLAQLPADVLIGLPLAIVGRAVARIKRLRHWAVTD